MTTRIYFAMIVGITLSLVGAGFAFADEWKTACRILEFAAMTLVGTSMMSLIYARHLEDKKS